MHSNVCSSICIIYSIEGRLICQIADRGPGAFRYRKRPRDEVGYLAYQPPFYAIYYISGGCDVIRHPFSAAERSLGLKLGSCVDRRSLARVVKKTFGAATVGTEDMILRTEDMILRTPAVL